MTYQAPAPSDPVAINDNVLSVMRNEINDTLGLYLMYPHICVRSHKCKADCGFNVKKGALEFRLRFADSSISQGCHLHCIIRLLESNIHIVNQYIEKIEAYNKINRDGLPL